MYCARLGAARGIHSRRLYIDTACRNNVVAASSIHIAVPSHRYLFAAGRPLVDDPTKAQLNVIDRHHSLELLMHRHVHIYIHKAGHDGDSFPRARYRSGDGTHSTLGIVLT